MLLQMLQTARTAFSEYLRCCKAFCWSVTMLKIYANAKLNIGLNILNKREDGYHNIYSLFVSAGLSDTVLIKKSSRYMLTSSDPDLLTDSSNLASKAAAALSEASGRELPAEIHLVKRIPAGAGLGGGSADCAAVLCGLNRLFSLGFSSDELKSIGEKIGADVPFLIEGGAAVCSGIGEIIDPVDSEIFSDYEAVICTSDIRISTAEAYRHSERFEKYALNDYDSFIRRMSSDDRSETAGTVNNDFEKYVFELYPDLKTTKDKLLEAGAVHAGMSGTGSGIYGIFRKGTVPSGFAVQPDFICRTAEFCSESLRFEEDSTEI